MKLNDEQFRRQTFYETSLYFISSLLNQGLFSTSEFSQAKDYLMKKYKPIIEH